MWGESRKKGGKINLQIEETGAGEPTATRHSSRGGRGPHRQARPEAHPTPGRVKNKKHPKGRKKNAGRQQQALPAPASSRRRLRHRVLLPPRGLCIQERLPCASTRSRASSRTAAACLPTSSEAAGAKSSVGQRPWATSPPCPSGLPTVGTVTSILASGRAGRPSPAGGAWSPRS